MPRLVVVQRGVLVYFVCDVVHATDRAGRPHLKLLNAHESLPLLSLHVGEHEEAERGVVEGVASQVAHSETQVPDPIASED